MYNHNHLIDGMFYKVYMLRGKMEIMPFDLLEMPLDVGDEITDHHAPQGIDANLAIEDFRERFGNGVTRVKVCEGVILSRRAAYDRDTLIWDKYNTLKYAQKVQAEVAVRELDRIATEASQCAEAAKNIHVGKYHLSMGEAIREHGIESGWYVRENGHTVWSEVKSLSETLVFGYRATRLNPTFDPWGHNRKLHRYDIKSETFHPNLHHLIFRKEPPGAWESVVRANVYTCNGVEYESTR